MQTNDPARQANIIGAMVLALADRLRAATEAAAPEAGPAAAALVLAGHAPGITLVELAGAVGLSHPGTVRLADRLAADGLVERRPVPGDGRAVGLHLTPAGRASADAILAARSAALAGALDLLPARDRAALATAAERWLLAGTKSDADAYRSCRLCDPGSCSDCPADAALAGDPPQ